MKEEMSLVQWALNVPGASRVLRKYHLNFCKNGKENLSKACLDSNSELIKILEELKPLSEMSEKIEWTIKPLSEITDHIINFYHNRLRLMFPELIFLADKVEKVHTDSKNCPKGLTHHLVELQSEMLNHMMKEEQILFPLIQSGKGQHAYMPIKVMTEEHTGHEESLKKLKSIAFDFSLPEGACNTWKRLYEGLDLLELELMEHISLEENIVFLRAMQGT